MGTAFAVGVTILLAGFLWFFVVRPILEDWGIIKERSAVNDYRPVMSLPLPPPAPDEQTDGADGPSVSAVLSVVERMELDKTKVPLIELMVYKGWTTAEIRAVLKGENATIGAEVDAARKRLGIVAPDRQLRVKDERGERVISLASDRAAR